jgi:hypothetical protein
MKPLTTTLADAANHKGAKLQLSRPSPPAARPPAPSAPAPRLHALKPPEGPDRSLVAKPEEKKKKKKKKKKKVFLDPSQKALIVAKVKERFNAEPGTPKMDIIDRFAAEFKVSNSLVKNLLKQADGQVAGNPKGGPPKLSIEIVGLEAYIAWHVKSALRKGFGE